MVQGTPARISSENLISAMHNLPYNQSLVTASWSRKSRFGMAIHRGSFDASLDCRPGNDEPVYSIGVAASLVRISPRTLRMYEAEGVLVTARKNGRRLYSDRDLHWVQCVRVLLHREGLNLAGVRCLLAGGNCWDSGCSLTGDCESCPTYQNRFLPCWSVVDQEKRKCNGCQVYRQATRSLCVRADLKLEDATV